jgi:hypothetical protein
MVGAGYAHVWSDLRFNGAENYQLQQDSIVGSFGRRFDKRVSLRLSAGALLGGHMSGEGYDYDLAPGWIVAVSGSYQLFGDPGRVPFLVATLTFGTSGTHSTQRGGSERTSFSTTDLRVGVMFGYTLWKRVSPYAAVRGFGGPVAWHHAGLPYTGTDRHHYTLGGGVSVSLPLGLDVRVDGSALGERSVSAGLALSL